ncbi:cytochrome b [Pusillimonas sp. SM2304]|uniref:cytochrome b n=1 Tax=Pusillimonas sp. SM2304 TaxID=3073241 RepID=UPI002873FCE5|nr:cytochrome b [Pusillimonas sp. SM2304]MDS1140879.1 cytochrome b [Pusillimonas sp. SM2304]
MSSTSFFRDSHVRYGLVSRCLHWLMTFVFAWQFTSVAARVLFEDSAFDEFMWATHKAVGATLMLLIVLRLLWWAVNANTRPPAVSLAARLGHLALYALMFMVPLIGLIRQYGSGRAFSAWGIPLMPGFEGDKIEWMTDLGGNFHGLLGWTLLALIVGHIGAALWHRRKGGNQVMQRMVGTV